MVTVKDAEKQIHKLNSEITILKINKSSLHDELLVHAGEVNRSELGSDENLKAKANLDVTQAMIKEIEDSIKNKLAVKKKLQTFIDTIND